MLTSIHCSRLIEICLPFLIILFSTTIIHSDASKESYSLRHSNWLGMRQVQEDTVSSELNAWTVISEVRRNRERRTLAGPKEDLWIEGLGPAFNIGGEPVYGSAAGPQIWSTIASDGANYLVVWSDLRNGSWDIYGARVTTDGSLLDSCGIAISIGAKDELCPAVAFDGTNYFVVWEDARNGSPDIYGAHVAVDGSVLEPSGTPIVTAPTDLRHTDLAFDGTNYLVVWQDSSSGSYDIYALRVDTGGIVIDSASIQISTAAQDQGAPAVAFDGTNYLIVWQDSRSDAKDIYGARVDTDGSVLDPLGIPISTAGNAQRAPDIAFGTNGYLVVWHDSRVAPDVPEIYGARVDTDGTVLDPSGIAISNGCIEPGHPKVSFDGDNYVVLWDGWCSGPSRDVCGTRVTPDGSVVDAPGVAIPPATDSSVGDLAFNGADYFVVWERGDVYGARVSVDLTLPDSTTTKVSMAARDQFSPGLAFDGANYLVVWHEHCCTDYDVYGARVEPGGAVLDPLGFAICTATGDQTQGRVAFDGSNYFVVWQDSRNGAYGRCDIYGSRITPGGSVLDPTGIPVSICPTDQGNPDIVFNGTNCFIVWHREITGPLADIYGAHVAPDGTVLDPDGIVISAASDTQEYPAVAFDGVNYLVVWQDRRVGRWYDIYGARVDTDGRVLDPDGVIISEAGWSQKLPDVAFDGSNYLVVWYDKRDGLSNDIYGARLNTDGGVLEPSGIPISTATDHQTGAAVVFDGVDYLVAWKDHRNGSFDTYGTRVSTGGVVRDPGGIPISVDVQNRLAPALVGGVSRQVLIAYSSFTPAVYGSYRIWGNFYISCAGIATGLGDIDTPWLYPNSPNPFWRSTTLRFRVPDSRQISIKVYDVRGQLVRTLFNGIAERGLNETQWDGTSADRVKVAPGIYFCCMEAREFRGTKKMMFLR